MFKVYFSAVHQGGDPHPSLLFAPPLLSTLLSAASVAEAVFLSVGSA